MTITPAWFFAEQERGWRVLDTGGARPPAKERRHLGAAAALNPAAGITPQLWPQHVLLAYIPEGDVQRDAEGFPVTCHCNFEMVRHVRTAAAGVEAAK